MARTRVTAQSENEGDIARQNWARYAYGKYRGHVSYCELARKLDAEAALAAHPLPTPDVA